MSLITLAQIRGVVLAGEGELSDKELVFWDSIGCEPEVWHDTRAGEHGFGSWVIARQGLDIIWFDSLLNSFHAATASVEGALPAPEISAKGLKSLLERLDG